MFILPAILPTETTTTSSPTNTTLTTPKPFPQLDIQTIGRVDEDGWTSG